MKRVASLLTLILGLGAFDASGAVIEVCKGCVFSSISEAVKSSKVGDHISVQPGIYEEPGIEINHSLTLHGEPGAEIRYQGTDGDTILIKAPQTQISGFKIQGSGKSTFHDFAAIKVANTAGCKILKNEILNSQYGILVTNSEGCEIRDNHISTSAVPINLLGDAIHLWKSNKPVISGNIVQGHRDGIYLEFVEEGLIENNQVSINHRYGLHFMFSSHNTFQNNAFLDNDAGVAVMYSKYIKMIANTYARNRGAASFGILLKDISDSVIFKNVFLDNTVAIFMEGSNRNKFSLNKFERNGWALRLLSSCEDNEFSQNAFFGNSLEIATNSSRSLNSFSKNFWDQHVSLDLDQDGLADLPFQPTSYSSYLVEKYSLAILLFDTPFLKILDRLEKYFPALSPVSLRDLKPLVRLPEDMP